MSIDPPQELKSLFETALNEFEKRTGANLAQHQIINELKNCESADSVIDILQKQAQAFRNFRGDDGKLMIWLKRTVKVLYTLSTSSVLGGAIGLVRVHSSWLTLAQHGTFFQPFPPVNAIFAGISVLLGVCVSPGLTREDSSDTFDLHQAIKDISKSYDALVELFESFESFLRRLDIYTKIPITTAMTKIIVKILIELLSTISLAVQQAKQGRLSEPHPLRYDT
jgi:hypothetical protein